MPRVTSRTLLNDDSPRKLMLLLELSRTNCQTEMDQYKYYLATNVLNEGQIVTYRSLSRALKVNVILAKQ